jgi:hypothetical protein
MYRNFNLTEEERKQIMEMHQNHGYKKIVQEQPAESNDQFLEWVKNATVSPFIAPNPYNGGDLKLGVKIESNDGKEISATDLRNPNQSMVINLIERLDVTTEDGKLVYSFGGIQLFDSSTFKANYEVINNSYVVYSIVGENSDMIQKLKQFTKPGKTNKFIVTVTPRLSSDLLKTGSKLFATKPNVLMVV